MALIHRAYGLFLPVRAVIQQCPTECQVCRLPAGTWLATCLGDIKASGGLLECVPLPADWSGLKLMSRIFLSRADRQSTAPPKHAQPRSQPGSDVMGPVSDGEA
jgi:hypothetical protein